eukprot:4724983-Lingulodinium_polyedra.AAC.1
MDCEHGSTHRLPAVALHLEGRAVPEELEDHEAHVAAPVGEHLLAREVLAVRQQGGGCSSDV